MNASSIERLDDLLAGYAHRREQKKAHPDAVLRKNWQFHDSFNQTVREHVIPVLQDFADQLRKRVDRATIFHNRNAAGMTIKLDQWEDYTREIVFFGDEAAEVVRITHEGKGFALLSSTLDVSELDKNQVEREVLGFLERVIELEPLGLTYGERVEQELGTVIPLTRRSVETSLRPVRKIA